MRPARIVHKAAEYLEELEAGTAVKMRIDKEMRGKFINVGDKKAGYVACGSWHWTAFARSRYKIEDLEMVKGYAEQE